MSWKGCPAIKKKPCCQSRCKSSLHSLETWDPAVKASNPCQHETEVLNDVSDHDDDNNYFDGGGGGL